VRSRGRHLLPELVFACDCFGSKALDQIKFACDDFRELLIEMSGDEDRGIPELLIGPGECPIPSPEY
jgi:hypothetical protein